jgi:hypothetical protein
MLMMAQTRQGGRPESGRCWAPMDTDRRSDKLPVPVEFWTCWTDWTGLPFFRKKEV